MSRRYTPLPSRAVRALEVLRPLFEKAADPVTPETAQTTLVDAGFERGEVSDILEVLLQRGYLYQVNGDVRVTGFRY